MARDSHPYKYLCWFYGPPSVYLPRRGFPRPCSPSPVDYRSRQLAKVRNSIAAVRCLAGGRTAALTDLSLRQDGPSRVWTSRGSNPAYLQVHRPGYETLASKPLGRDPTESGTRARCQCSRAGEITKREFLRRGPPHVALVRHGCVWHAALGPREFAPSLERFGIYGYTAFAVILREHD